MSTVALERKLRTQRIVSLILAAALVFLGVAYTLLWNDTKDLAEAPVGGGGSTPTTQEPTTPGAPDTQDQTAQEPDLSTASYMALGDADAPVTIYEWTDYTCPYCGLYHRDTLPDIIAEYIDTGQVRLEVHDVTFIGDQAEDAAVAARAAGQQDRYFDYLFAVYDLGADGARPNLDEAQLASLADDLGLDPDEFAKDVEDTGIRQEVQQSTRFAQSIGISSVPIFLVTHTGTLEGAQQLQGAQGIDAFRQVIDAQLASAGT